MAEFYVKPGVTEQRAAFYERLSARNLAPLWEAMAGLVTPEPRPACVPAHWRYEDLRPMLMEGGTLITAEEAERRVLVLENPGIRGRSQITQSLYAGLQLVLPGEIAPSHRHVASALRFIVEGRGAYTAVDGERVDMAPGDFIITPSWTFHDHGNAGDEPVVWLDGLDVPIVNTFDASFAERYREPVQPIAFEPGYSALRYGHGLLPFEHDWKGTSSPLFHYPYERSRSALEGLARRGEPDPSHGIKLQYVNPVNGRAPVPTMGAFLQWLPERFRGGDHRSTDATIFQVVEGSGRSVIDGAVVEWREKDVFVVPSWSSARHESDGVSVLFSFSDRPAQQALGIWREGA
jgi:gentisate 1,2-dioxygenase